MSEKLLEISGLSVCYEGEQILNNICFSVEKLTKFLIIFS